MANEVHDMGSPEHIAQVFEMLMPGAAEANNRIRFGLDLIKLHITEAETQRNRDLHKAIGIIVSEFRALGRL